MNFPFEAHLRLSLALTWRKQCPRCAENSITASSPPPPLHELCRNLVDAESLKVHFHRLCLQSWQRPAFRVRRRGQKTTLTLRSLEVGCLRIIGLQSQSLSTPRKQICSRSNRRVSQVSPALFYDPRLWRRGVLTGSASSQQMCSLQNHLTMSSSVTQPSPSLHFCVHDCRGTRLSRPSGGISPDQSEGTPT